MTVRMGRTVMWCAACGAFHPAPPDGGNTCGVCGAFMSVRRCYRCGHEWVPRDFDRVPGTCPGCKSPYWCRTRVRG